MTTSHIELSNSDAIATLTINRPSARNAINQTMWLDIIEALHTVEKDKTVRALVVCGSNQCFSAGADIREFATLVRDNDKLKANNELIQKAQVTLEELSKPTLAKIDGPCVGGGLGLALACDIRVASEHAVFAITPAKLGLIYSLRDTRRLFALAGPAVTKELLFTGKKIQSEQALKWNLVNHIVKRESLDGTVAELADDIDNASQYSIQNIKRIIASLQGLNDLQADEINALFNEAFYSDDAQEGVAAFLEKRAAKFSWNS